MAKQTAEVAEKARDDVKEMADRMVTMMAESKEEKAAGEQMAVSRLGEVPLLPRTVQGWAVRLGVVVLLLRWRPLCRLVGRLFLALAE